MERPVWKSPVVLVVAFLCIAILCLVVVRSWPRDELAELVAVKPLRVEFMDPDVKEPIVAYFGQDAKAIEKTLDRCLPTSKGWYKNPSNRISLIYSRSRLSYQSVMLEPITSSMVRGVPPGAKSKVTVYGGSTGSSLRDLIVEKQTAE